MKWSLNCNNWNPLELNNNVCENYGEKATTPKRHEFFLFLMIMHSDMFFCYSFSVIKLFFSSTELWIFIHIFSIYTFNIILSCISRISAEISFYEQKFLWNKMSEYTKNKHWLNWACILVWKNLLTKQWLLTAEH